MPRKKRRQRAGQSNYAIHRALVKRKRYWDDILESWDEHSTDLANPQGRCCAEENRLVLLGVRMALRLTLQLVEAEALRITNVSWSYIDALVAKELHKSPRQVREIRQTYLEDNEVLVFGQTEDSVRGGGAKQYSLEQCQALHHDV